jgi:hypothetical protein
LFADCGQVERRMAVVRFMFLLGLAIGFFVVQDAWARGDRRLSGERLLETDPLAGPALRSLIIEEFGWRSIGGRKKIPPTINPPSRRRLRSPLLRRSVLLRLCVTI